MYEYCLNTAVLFLTNTIMNVQDTLKNVQLSTSKHLVAVNTVWPVTT